MTTRYPRGPALGIVTPVRRLHALHIACVLVLASSLAALAVGACGGGLHYICEVPDIGHHAENGLPDECHCYDDPTGTTVGGRDPDACDPCNGQGLDPSTGASCVDAGTDGQVQSGEHCAGQCWPNPPAGWSPTLLAVGPSDEIPSCPNAATSTVYEGLAGLHAPPVTCGACTCDPPSGHCSLPTKIVAENSVCSGAAPIQIAFDAPAGWDGSCANGGAVAAGAMWNGAPAVQSVTVEPITLTEAHCTPHGGAVVTTPPFSWASSARACTGTSVGLCPTSKEMCGPAAAAGFSVCVYQPGEVDCPTFSPYIERHVFYQGATDTRACSPCACDGPLGSTCTATVTIYADSMCAGTPVLSASLDTAEPHCHPVPAGTALGSKAATPPVYVPGQCPPSGGEPTGAAVPRSPSTFCCLPAT